NVPSKRVGRAVRRPAGAVSRDAPHLRETARIDDPDRGSSRRHAKQEILMAPKTRNPQPTEPSAPERRKPTKDLGKTTRDLPRVALRETVIFPEMIVPLQVGREKSVAALNAAVANGGPIALVTQRVADQEEIGSPSELYPVGTLAKIAQIVQLQDGTVRAIVQGQGRLRVHGFTQTSPYILAT